MDTLYYCVVVQKTPFRSRILPFPTKQNINIAVLAPFSSNLEPSTVTPIVIFTDASQEMTDADTAAVAPATAPATHSVEQDPLTHSGPAAADSSPAVGSPAVGSPAVGSLAVGSPAVGRPAVDSPAVDSLAVDGPAADNPAVALHSPVVHTSLAADTLAQESPDTTARLVIGPLFSVLAAISAF